MLTPNGAKRYASPMEHPPAPLHKGDNIKTNPMKKLILMTAMLLTLNRHLSRL